MLQGFHYRICLQQIHSLRDFSAMFCIVKKKYLGLTILSRRNTIHIDQLRSLIKQWHAVTSLLCSPHEFPQGIKSGFQSPFISEKRRFSQVGIRSGRLTSAETGKAEKIKEQRGQRVELPEFSDIHYTWSAKRDRCTVKPKHLIQKPDSSL